MKPQSIAFRLDASPRIGYGHLARCSALMEIFLQKGWQIVVFTRDAYRARVFLSEKELSQVEVRQLEQAGVIRECREVQSIVDEENISCLVVDHYEYTQEHLKLLKEAHSILLCVDDGLKEAYPVDILVNPNLGASESRPTALPHTQCLLGTDFLLIRKSFREVRSQARRDQSVSGCFLCFGGSDPRNATGEVLRLLDLATDERLSVDVVLGPGFANSLAIDDLANLEVALHKDPDNLPSLMSKSSFAIVSPSSIFWELACLGIPAITITTAQNHQHVGEKLGDAGLSRYLGPLGSFGPNDLRSAIQAATSKTRDERLVKKLQAAVDGEGASRVFATVEKALGV